MKKSPKKTKKMIKVASVVLVNDEGKILVLKRHSTCKGNPRKWNFPGGHIEKNETPKEAAIRECQEEANITPTEVTFYGNYGKMVVFIGKSNETPKINEESEDWKFITQNDVEELEFVKNAVIVLNKIFKERS